MEMHQIRYFLAVSEYLNFRRAAEECHVSAPALTRAIQKLEAGSDRRNLAGLDRRPQLVTRSRDLHSGGTNVSVAPCSLAKRRVAARILRNLALWREGQDRDQCRQRNINLKVLERLI